LLIDLITFRFELPGDVQIRNIECTSKESKSLYSVTDWFIDKGVITGELQGKTVSASIAVFERQYSDVELEFKRLLAGQETLKVSLRKNPDESPFAVKYHEVKIGG
jgi:hypothetical protein